ncbi:MAG: phenylalanine--tRNA ligase subunit beta [Sphingobacteriaceae bacterium]|nr:phenylalanine--tRNA ligase subunit beta [Sphingobacteriaceae bacterium]
MKISYNWLKTLLPVQLSAEEVAALLTDSGLEVESVENYESIPGGLKGLIAGEVLECTKHPDADRLSLTKVDVGNGNPLSIVCGAPNVQAGQKVIVAMVGTKLFPVTGEPFEIKKSKIRGALSEGMLCAEDEIGIGVGHAGIYVLPQDTPVGKPISEYFKIENDSVFEIGLTPNRSDAASHLGVARDLQAILNSKNKDSQIQIIENGYQELPESSNINKIEIEVTNHEDCPRYSGIIISGIEVKESPDWLKTRIKSIGLRTINNIVDITNFVMHELGQPLHAFDLEKIEGKKIIVRRATKGEKFKTLDEIERTLHEEDLMICDAVKPMCIAGVFGGLHSGVSANTNSIFIESAYFNPAAVRKSSKRHGLKTDASFRFERGADPDSTSKALVRAANLILEIAGGTLSMGLKDIYPNILEPFKVAFSYNNCNNLIGKEIDKSIIKSIIQNLGIQIEKEGADGLLLKVPCFKSDVTREADVIEEVLRIYGYNNVESAKNIHYSTGTNTNNETVLFERRVAETLMGCGYHEMMGLSLSSDRNYSNIDHLVKVINPLSSDLNVLRAEMLYGGLEAIAYNINRKSSDLRFFEIGRTYQINPDSEFKYAEQKHIALFLTGEVYPENAYGLKMKTDLSVLKAALQTLFLKCGVNAYKVSESNHECFEYGLDFSLNGKIIAEAGLVKKMICKKSDVNQAVYYAKINWELLLKAFKKRHIEFSEISKFPAVRRDLALLLNSSVKYNSIEEIAFASEKKLLKEVNLFDIYSDAKLGDKKSYALSFVLQDDQATLTDKQIDGVMDKLLKNFKEKLGAELRQ